MPRFDTIHDTELTIRYYHDTLSQNKEEGFIIITSKKYVTSKLTKDVVDYNVKFGMDLGGGLE